VARDCGWALVGVAPDLSCWGKSIANGYPISAVLGNDKARAAAGSIFVTGSFWFAAVAMAAGIVTMDELRSSDYLEKTVRLGDRLRAGLKEKAEKHGFSIRQTGPSQMPMVLFDDDPDFRVGYGWCAEMVGRGIYVHPWHNMFLCAAMTESDIDSAVAAADESFRVVAKNRSELVPHPGLAAMLQGRRH